MDTYALYHTDEPERVYIVTADSWESARQEILKWTNVGWDASDLVGRKHPGKVVMVSASPLINNTI